MCNQSQSGRLTNFGGCIIAGRRSANPKADSAFAPRSGLPTSAGQRPKIASKDSSSGKAFSPNCASSDAAASARASFSLHSPAKSSSREDTGPHYFEGGGTGNLSSAVFTHLSPSSISMTGISSTIGYLRPQSWHISHIFIKFQHAIFFADAVWTSQDLKQFLANHVRSNQGVILPR